jgi:hypothetical protein
LFHSGLQKKKKENKNNLVFIPALSALLNDSQYFRSSSTSVTHTSHPFHRASTISEKSKTSKYQASTGILKRYPSTIDELYGAPQPAIHCG